MRKREMESDFHPLFFGIIFGKRKDEFVKDKDSTPLPVVYGSFRPVEV
jgi:hypothetical protein